MKIKTYSESDGSTFETGETGYGAWYGTNALSIFFLCYVYSVPSISSSIKNEAFSLAVEPVAVVVVPA